MSTNSQSLVLEICRNLVLQTKRWDKYDDVYVAVSADGVETEVHKNELEHLDYRLPALLDKLYYAYLGDMQAHAVPIGVEVNRTFHYWEIPDNFQLLTDIHNRQYLCLELDNLYLDDIYNVATINSKSMRLETFDMPNAEGQNVSVQYLSKADKQFFQIDKDWLDQHYAGWNERYEAMRVLDCPKKEWYSHVFLPTAPQVDITMNGLSFD